MIPIIIFLLSIGLQLTAAVIALLLIRITGRKLAWILIAIAMVLMASRRIVSFVSLVSAGKEITFDIPELIALVISILMLFGVLRIRNYFRSIGLAEERLQASEKKHRMIVENVDEIIYMVSIKDNPFTGKIDFVSPQTEKIIGYSPEDFLRDAELWFRIIHPDDVPSVVKCTEEAFKKQETGIRYYRVHHKEKTEYIWLEDKFIPVIEDNNNVTLFGVARDITMRKRAEEALAFLANITENATDAIVGLDLDTNIVLWNRGAERIFGYSSEEILGKPWSTVVPTETLEVCLERFKRATIKGFVETAETVRVKKDGMKFPAEMTLTALKDERGAHIGFVSITRDITERKKLGEQLRHAQKMQAIGQLAGGVAHEFNNILTTIIGYGDMLLMKMREDDPLRHNVEQILTSSERAANLTQGLLAYSRKQATMLKPVSLNEIIKKTEGLLMKIVSEDIKFRTVIAEEDLTVMADRGQIEQVLVNLATNAKDAMPDGGVLTIEIKRVKNLDIRTLSEVRIGSNLINKDSEIEKDFAGIFVTDTGIGIDKDIEERIFEPFFTTKDIGKGTGLGLAIVYGIIKQHDGYINVYSEPGKGTTFKIYLPIIKSKVEEEAKPVVISLPAGGKEMVLIAEDDKALRALIKTVLSEFGYKVIDAVDGEDAIEKFIQNKDEIDLVILDVIMPKKNGKEVYEEIKKIKPEIKAIFASGYTADIIHKKGVIEEGIDLILKPVSPKDLLKKVREVLDR